jgi:uncharacterized membrane protein YfhO
MEAEAVWINRYILCGLIIAVLVPLAPFLAGRFFSIGDMRDVFIPLESFFREQQLQGHIPSWNPAVSFGFPVLASAQIGFFYPPLFVLRFLPIFLELPLVIILHVAAMVIGTFLFARRLSMSKEAAFLSAISFTLSQFVWQHITHLNIFLAIAWFPWQIWAVHILFQKQKINVKDIAVLGTLFGIPLLIGQLQIQIFMMMIALLYGFTIRWKQGFRTLSSLGICISIGLISILLASVQLLPTLELATLSSRSTSEGFDIVRANQHSYPLYHLPTLLFPRFYGNDNTYWGKRLEIEYGSYIGVIPLILAVWAMWNRKKGDSLFFPLLALITFLLALGSLSPFRLIGLEPSLWFFSAPARWLLFTTFASSILAGFGFDAIWNTIVSAKKFFKASAIVILSFIMIGNVILYISTIPFHEKLSSMVASAKHSSISFASPYTYVTILSMIAFPFVLQTRNAKRNIIGLVALDLIVIATTTTPLLPWNKILAAPTTIHELPSDVREHSTRIYSLRDGGDTGAYFTNPSSRADDTKREQQRQLLLPMISSQFGIYGIEWPASLDIQEQAAALEQLHPNEPYAIENEALADELTIGSVLSPSQDVSVHIQQRTPKPRIELVDGSATIVSERPSSITIQTNSSKDSTLIVRDTWYPGWHAYVDGIDVSIEKSPLFFRSVEVRSGKHTVEMKYIPTSLYIGGGISLATLCGISIVMRLRKYSKYATIGS